MKQTRIDHEKDIVELMVQLYCRKKEGSKALCMHCRTLLEYAHARLEHCPFNEEKPTCRVCTVHCYKPEMRKQMQEIMRYAGPRMILYHPIAAICHFIREIIHHNSKIYL